MSGEGPAFRQEQSNLKAVSGDRVDPLVTAVAGYVIGSIVHGGLDLSLIDFDAATTDNRATFIVESKRNRKRLQISVREIHETP